MSTATTFPSVDHDREGGGERPRRRLRRRTVVIALAATVAVVVLLTWLVAFSSVLGVGTVAVRGTHTLSAGQVRRAAAVTADTPLVRLDTAAITRRVEKLPDVASAQVSTSFPSTVVIAITERTPVGWVRSGGNDVLVDKTGDPYRSVHPAPQDVPKLVVAGGATGRATRSAVASVAAALPARLRADVDSIQALDPTSITLVLTHGRIVRWGSADRTAEKARILPVLLAHQATQIDVTDPDLPFTR